MSFSACPQIDNRNEDNGKGKGKGAIVLVHQHENEQLTYCLSGLMRFTLPDRTLVLRPGEVLLIPGGVSHGAEMPEETVEMDFFSPPRQDWIAKTDAYLRK